MLHPAEGATKTLAVPVRTLWDQPTREADRQDGAVASGPGLRRNHRRTKRGALSSTR